MQHIDRMRKPRMPKGNMNGWQERHLLALMQPQGGEKPLVGLIASWLEYADWHRSTYESGIGEDGVLGPEWAAIGAALRGLLNGDAGRLDCGTLDGTLYTALQAEGFDPDTL